MSVLTQLGERASVFRTAPPKPPKSYSSISIVRSENAQITLPEGMSYDDAIAWLMAKKKDEFTVVRFQRSFPCHPHDGAVALNGVIKALFGWAEMKFPTYIDVKVGVDEVISVPWCSFNLPGIDGTVYMGQAGGSKDGDGKWVPLQFQLSAEIRKMDLPKMEMIAELVSEWAREKSIYKGKAVDLSREFVDLSKADESDLIFGADLAAQINTSIFTPLEHTQLCVEAGVPLKRGILLYGPPGCGKTMLARVTAKKAVDNGWGFILGRPQDKLPELIAFAEMYQPCVIFMEDVDVAAGGQERNERINEILNTVDGLASKNRRMMLVLTTNEIMKISGPMLRPGRLDALIYLGHPAPDAIERLMRKYGRGLVPPEADLSKAVAVCHEAKFIPATIAEVVQRAKLFAIAREKRADVLINGEDLEYAAGLLVNQSKLINRPKGEPKPVPITELLVRMPSNGHPVSVAASEEEPVEDEQPNEDDE